MTPERKNGYVDTRLEEGYEPLVSLDANDKAKERPLTLGQIPVTLFRPMIPSPTGRLLRSTGQSITKISDITAQPNRSSLYLQRASLRYAKRTSQGAIADCDRAIKIEKNKPRPYLLRGQFKAENGDVEGAASDYTQAASIDPKDGYAYVLRSVLRRQKDDDSGALADADHAVTLAPALARGLHGTRGRQGLARAPDGGVSD